MQPVEQAIKELGAATDALVAGIGGLTDADVREPSLLPGWTRGHVLTHLARNAEGGTRLLSWARTGIASYEYESLAARAAAIERGAGRRAVVLLADVSAAAAGFAEAAALMPADAWQHLVTWTTGQQTPAEDVIRSRHAEVLIHHVDLDLGFGPSDWPPTFVREMLEVAVSALNEGGRAPLSAGLHASDTGRSYLLGGGSAGAVQIGGTEAGLLAWLLGRSAGAHLTRDKPGPLPPLPTIYHA
jgi:maleylpyruvate isomerase